jgi:hypothetical protein
MAAPAARLPAGQACRPSEGKAPMVAVWPVTVRAALAVVVLATVSEAAEVKTVTQPS